MISIRLGFAAGWYTKSFEYLCKMTVRLCTIHQGTKIWIICAKSDNSPFSVNDLRLGSLDVVSRGRSEFQKCACSRSSITYSYGHYFGWCDSSNGLAVSGSKHTCPSVNNVYDSTYLTRAAKETMGIGSTVQVVDLRNTTDGDVRGAIEENIKVGLSSFRSSQPLTRIL
jgi:hypothetical protein